MSDEIRADYDELEQVASRFASQSQAVQQMMQRVKASADKLIGGDWKGRGIEAFQNEMNDEVFPATQRLFEALEEARR
jgi:WXG100 family type VII secretion target